jgi:hypothetical protein
MSMVQVGQQAMVHILLIEDNPGDVLMIREALRTCSVPADVIIAFDGEEGLHFGGCTPHNEKRPMGFRFRWIFFTESTTRVYECQEITPVCVVLLETIVSSGVRLGRSRPLFPQDPAMPTRRDSISPRNSNQHADAQPF